jgi:dTDP-4-amino-4,6-dideoxygalactose transaminase
VTAQPLVSVFGAATGDEEVEALTASVRSGWMGMGPRVREFESAFAERLGTDFAMTDSGSNALLAAVWALDLPPRSEIVLPSFTWVSCAHAIVLAGHTPVFADVDPDTGNVDSAHVERARTHGTQAVMVVHYAGRPVDLEPILALGLPVIEDAAHAVDSAADGRLCGTQGDVGVFSFDGVKNLATPDGGGVSSSRPEVMEAVRRLRYCGIGGSGFDRSERGGRWWENDDVTPFPRAIPNDVSASIGLVQLQRLAANQQRRTALWARYQQELADLAWLVRPHDPAAGTRHSYFTYLVRVADGRRDQLAHHLLAQGIYTTLRYQPLHLVPRYATAASLPGCDLLAEQGLNLPLHPRLTDEEQGRVIDALRVF